VTVADPDSDSDDAADAATDPTNGDDSTDGTGSADASETGPGLTVVGAVAAITVLVCVRLLRGRAP